MSEQTLDRRVRKTKKLLRQGLMELMREKSIKDISVRELTDKVDVNRGTFYLHYRDIYDMVEQIENEMIEELIKLLDIHHHQGLQSEPLPVLIDVFTFLSKNTDIAAVFLGNHGDLFFADKIKDIVKEKFINEWLFKDFSSPKKENIEYFYAFIFAGCIGIYRSWLESDLKRTPTEMATIAEQIILHGRESLNK